MCEMRRPPRAPMRSHRLLTRRADVPTVRKWNGLSQVTTNVAPQRVARASMQNGSRKQTPVHGCSPGHVPDHSPPEKLLVESRMQPVTRADNPQVARIEHIPG